MKQMFVVFLSAEDVKALVKGKIMNVVTDQGEIGVALVEDDKDDEVEQWDDPKPQLRCVVCKATTNSQGKPFANLGSVKHHMTLTHTRKQIEAARRGN